MKIDENPVDSASPMKNEGMLLLIKNHFQFVSYILEIVIEDEPVTIEIQIEEAYQKLEALFVCILLNYLRFLCLIFLEVERGTR